MDFTSSPRTGDTITVIGGTMSGTTGIVVAVGTSDSRPARTEIVFTTEAGWRPGGPLTPGATHKVPLSQVTWNIPAAQAIRADTPADIPYRVRPVDASPGRPICENSVMRRFGK